MCEPAPKSKAPYVLSAAVAGVALYAASAATAKPATIPKPVAAPAPVHAGTPWLTISATALATLAVAGLIVAVVLAVRRHRREVEQARRAAAVRQVARRPVPQRAIEAAPVPAREWLKGGVDAR